MEQVTIRELTRADMKLLAGLLQRLVDEVGEVGISKLMRSDVVEAVEDMADDSKAISPQMIGIMISTFKKLLATFGSEMEKWFSDLISVPVEEMDALPFSTDVSIILQIVEQEGVEDFFSKALRTYNWTKGLARLFGIKPKVSDTITE